MRHQPLDVGERAPWPGDQVMAHREVQLPGDAGSFLPVDELVQGHAHRPLYRVLDRYYRLVNKPVAHRGDGRGDVREGHQLRPVPTAEARRLLTEAALRSQVCNA